MSLPKLNDTPLYDITIPSINLKTRFRPYLVKEEKVLLIALESEDEKQITQVIIDLIKACISEPIDEKKLTTFDMEYLFTQIRAKSVGETAKVILLCQSDTCQTSNEVSVPIAKAGVDLADGLDKNIDLTDDISIEMKYLSYYDILNAKEDKKDITESEIIFNNIILSMVSISANDERILFKDEGYEATIEFVNNLTTSQFGKLRDFVINTPRVKLKIDYKCKGCGHDNTVMLAGLHDFFQ
jgi:hypothetical protein